jgi:excinuclease ABC subunit C
MRDQLTDEMKKAAAAQEFERAAELRDLLVNLQRTTRKVNRFERVPYSLPQAIEPERDLAELAQVLGLPAPPKRIEGFDISNISGTFKVASLVSFWCGRPDRSNYRRFRIKTVEGQDDFASVAEVVRRRYSRVLNEMKARAAAPEQPEAGARPTCPEATPAAGSSAGSVADLTLSRERGEAVPRELQRAIDDVSAAVRGRRDPRPGTDAAAADIRAGRAPGVRGQKGAPGLPDLVLIDGGKGQLGAACAELEKLGLSQIPVIGLAKEFEEIFRPGEKEPLRLSQESGALKLLQRVRDESHRLANTYNAELRLKKISESILDEFPNIGGRRKAALLKKFGSVQRIRLATVDQISQVPGFGGKAAAELKAFLEARQ